MIRAVIFDFDGVLADTERLHLGAFQEAFGARGWTLAEAAYFERYLGYGDLELIETFTQDHGLSLGEDDRAAIEAAKSEAFRARLASGNVLYPEAAACVMRLGHRFRLAIASGALRAEIVDILNAGDLRRHFPVVVGADDVRHSKPAPDPYLKAAAGLGVDPAVCVAVEDSRWGIEAARAAGMRTVAITTTLPAAALSAADRIIHSLAELTPDVVDALAGRAFMP